MLHQYSLVKIADEEVLQQYEDNVFDGESTFIFLGEIPNMLGHCVVAGYINGKIYAGFHNDLFVEVED